MSNGDKMEVEMAEQKMNELAHSEQHYFKRYVCTLSGDCAPPPCCLGRLHTMRRCVVGDMTRRYSIQ